ncbi:hypothetical protein L3Y34_016215 [Caenorhabditis briggsae]|nr:hypothetical protein L3Y34_016211 [Caenorhabditis briggsae]ULU13560.1 hypothetical protein L3Y34_016213 [Caenorhabditis briggsae]ULU13565.1 hypothetical protein L3Y34_016215 [Caenorhabditis briggsae]
MATGMSQDFNITNVGYYKRDNEMNVTVDARPSHLNGNHIQFQELQTSEGYVPKDQCINLAEPEVIDNGNIENYFESLLNYISIEGFGKEKPLFVTNKSFMGYLASKPIRGTILIFRYMGIIFISYEKRERKSPEDDKKKASDALAYTHGANYAHYLKKKSDEEKIPEDYAKSGCKAVMKCDVSIGYKKETVLYSAEIDALDELNQHIELKAIVYGTDNEYFWKSNICTFYWKMFFGGCSMMLVGDKFFRGEVPGCYLSRIEELKIGEIIDKTEKAKQKRDNLEPTEVFEEWSLEKGKERVRQFFREVNAEVQMSCRDSDVCILAKTDQQHWKFKPVNEQNETIQEFVKLVKTKMDIWRTNFSN